MWCSFAGATPRPLGCGSSGTYEYFLIVEDKKLRRIHCRAIGGFLGRAIVVPSR